MAAWGVIGTVLVCLLLFLLVAVVVWWLRTRLDSPARSFRAHLRSMEKEIGAGDRYQTPWVLLVGDQADVAANLCNNWRLIPEARRRWFGQWWYGSDGAVLVTPSDMFHHADGAVPQLSAWRRLLNVLVRVRPNRPLDAVIWTVSAEQLWSGNSAVAAGLAAYRKFADLQQRLGLSLPVYLVVTGIESVPGMLEFAQNLPDEAQDIMLGWSSPFAPGMSWRADWADMAVDHVSATLAEEITELGALAGGVGEQLYLLPRQFDQIRGNLQALCDPVFRGNALGEAPSFRGIYFVGSWSVDAEDHDAFAASGNSVVNTVPLFVTRLLRQRVLAETGLAQPVPRILAMRQKRYRWTGYVAAALSVLWLVGMVWTWAVYHTDAITLAEQLRTIKDERGSNRLALTTDEAAAQSVNAWWRVISAVPRWHFGTPVYPTSLLSSVDERIDAQVLGIARHSVVMPLQYSLQRNTETVRAMGNNSRDEEGDDTDAPDHWPRYLLTRQLVESSVQLEQQSGLYNRALAHSAVPLDDFVDLANTMYKLDMRSSQLSAHTYLNQVLDDANGRLAQPLQLSGIHQDTAGHFTQLMQAWLDRLYDDATFAATAGAVQKQVDSLKAGSPANGKELAQLNEHIDLLRRLVAATDAAWNRSGNQELVPGYAAMMNQAAHSHLIGAPAVEDVNQHADTVREAFRTRWITDAGPHSGVLQKQNGNIQIADELTRLDVAIEALLGQDFMSVLQAHSQGNAGAEDMMLDADSLTTALRYYASYHAYVEQNAQQVPENERRAIVASARFVAAQAMWDSISSHVHESGTGAADAAQTFANLARKAADTTAGLEELDRHDLASALIEQVNRVAISALKRADTSMQQMAPYEPLHGSFTWWDGGKNASLKAWRMSSQQDLQQYLVSQAEALATLSAGVAPALGWLNNHVDQLRVGEPQLLARWNNMGIELQKYKDKSSTSAPALLEHLISKDFNEMDLTTCVNVLTNAGLPTGDNEFSARARDLIRIASDRCNGLRMQAAAAAWDKLSSYFSLYLAGRFPFAETLAQQEADPARVVGLLRLLDENQAAIEAGLQDSNSTALTPAAQKFLQRLQQGRSWLGPLLLRDASGTQGLDIDIAWRTDRNEEEGADQVIEWGVGVGNQSLRYPATLPGRLHWTVGLPVSSSLRWAKDGLQMPQDDPYQAALNVNDRIARWSYGNDWALLRWMRDHVAPSQLLEIDDASTPLMFAVPVAAPQDKLVRAHMFARVTLLAAGGKTPVMPSMLPIKAPQSPFRAVILPDTKPLAQATP